MLNLQIRSESGFVINCVGEDLKIKKPFILLGKTNYELSNCYDTLTIEVALSPKLILKFKSVLIALLLKLSSFTFYGKKHFHNM